MNDVPLVAGVELGGTKTIAVLGNRDAIVERIMVPTTSPGETLGAVAAHLARWRPSALGIASFGPVALDRKDALFGRILATPKAGWEGTDLIAALAYTGPVELSTDVIAAALAEGDTGAARGMSDFVYVTIGTGIGVGIIAAGRPVTGQMHPEAGHLFVPRIAEDDFAGTCAFHRDCLEGLAAGPAIAARAGIAGQTVPDDHPCWRFVVDALAHGFANLRLSLATEAIVIGGGVAVARPWLAGAIAARMDAILANYLPTPSRVVPATLGADAGPRGALLLALAALDRQENGTP
jgi:fructokinase